MSVHSEAACKKCTYFDDHAANGQHADAEAGLCRFNPPVTQPEPDAHGLWPIVAKSDWCGHFETGTTVN